VELVNCLNKFSKNEFLAQSLESLDLLEECSMHLSKSKDIIPNIMKAQGNHFYQKDLENMQRCPPHYGLQKQAQLEEMKKDDQ